MMYSLALELLLSSVAGILARLLTLIAIDFHQFLQLPPGLTPLPSIDNKLSLLKSKPWLQFEK
jgi:hypothetical protein